MEIEDIKQAGLTSHCHMRSFRRAAGMNNFLTQVTRRILYTSDRRDSRSSGGAGVCSSTSCLFRRSRNKQDDWTSPMTHIEDVTFRDLLDGVYTAFPRKSITPPCDLSCTASCRSSNDFGVQEIDPKPCLWY